MTTVLLNAMILTFSNGKKKLHLHSTICLISLLFSFVESESNFWNHFHFSPPPLEQLWFYQKLYFILCFQCAKPKQIYYKTGDINAEMHLATIKCFFLSVQVVWMLQL